MKKFITLLLAAAMLASISCGDTPTPSGSDTTTGADNTTAEPSEYTYPDVDLGGSKVTFLNYAEMWSCNMTLDFEEATGEGLSDAIYNRNRKVEEKLNFEMEEIQVKYPGWDKIAEIVTQLQNSVMAGDTEYDVAYLPIYFKPGIVTEGYLYDIATMPNVDLNQAWWDQTINDSLLINGKLYAASSPLQLMSLDMSWVLLFNQEILDDNKIAYPYDDVRNGTWTLDKANEYSKKVINLNGADSYSWAENGATTYGVAVHPGSVRAFTHSADNILAKLNDGKFDYNMESERLYTTLEKVADLLNPNDGSGIGDSGEAVHYINKVFKNGRSLFITCELKATLELRDMKDSFGLLPFPKFDEDQENYITSMNTQSCFLTIPSNVENAANVGAVLDALTYESYKTLIPAYYDVTLSYKGLRDDNSIEMLDIIRNTRAIDLSLLFAVTGDIHNTLQSLAVKGDASNVASAVAEKKPGVIAKADKLLEALK